MTSRPMPEPRPDPGFNINTATNTFYKALGDRVKSGQMTVAQAQEAQAAMRQLQLNPQLANRQAATDIAQRYLQVGRYSPNNVAALVTSPPQGGLALAQTRPDPDFNINTATNTFYKQLGDRVASGQMTLDQARAAQAEMRALQLNPAMANRAAATEIAQRHLQVGPYSPNNVAQRQLTPAVNAEAGIPLWRQLAPSPERDAAYAAHIAAGGAPSPYMKPQGMTTGLGKALGGMFGAQPMTGDLPVMPKPATPMPYNPINTTTADDLRPRGGAGVSVGSILQGLRNMQQQPQSSFVDTMPKMSMPAPTGPQVMAPNAQGMALGGLMEKYGGGMC